MADEADQNLEASVKTQDFRGMQGVWTSSQRWWEAIEKLKTERAMI